MEHTGWPAPGPLGEEARVPGLLLATVLENSDQQHKGMLKIRYASEDAQKSIVCWVKALAPFAGDGYGAFALPEVGEQVVVGFLEGSFARPFVLGSLYTAADQMLQDCYHQDNVQKRLDTKGGIHLRLSDEKQKAQALVETPGGLSITLSQEGKKICVDTGKCSVTLEGEQGNVTVEAQNEIVIKTSGASLKLTSSEAELKAASIKINATGTLELKGGKSSLHGSTAEVGADTLLRLSGSPIKLN